MVKAGYGQKNNKNLVVEIQILKIVEAENNKNNG